MMEKTVSTKHPKNEQVKNLYFDYLRHAEGKSEATIRQIITAIGRFERFTRNADFRCFDQKQAIGFKDHMAKQSLAAATVLSTIKQVKRFFAWLTLQAGYKSRVRLNDVEYLNLSEKDVRAASSARVVSYPTVAMVEAAIAVMPDVTDIEKRNRALVAFGALTAARVGAVISLKRKHFDKRRMLVMQEPREVNTKASKRIDTFLTPVSDAIETVFMDWVEHYDSVLMFGPEDPLFPNTKMGHDNERQFRAIGLRRDHWKTAGPLRDIYKAAFQAAGLPSYNPHSFRNMLVAEMYQRGLSVAAFKAGSQNLGHESALTTLTSYGKIPLEEQGRLIRDSFTEPPKDGNDKFLTRAEFEAMLKTVNRA